MIKLYTAAKAYLRRLHSSTFFMNALYLMLATFVVAGLGFVFWVVIARSYSSTTVGLAATLLSMSGLLSMLSLAGFDTALVRFLPKSKRKNDHINSGLVIVTILSGILSLAFVLSLPFAAPSLAFVLHNLWYAAGFIFFTIATALNILTNAVFLAAKRARDIFIINLLFSALKVILPLLIIKDDVMAIFVMVGATQLVGLILSLAVMKNRLGYRFWPKVHADIVRTTKKYSFSVYVSSILNLLPPTLLPLMVVQQLGAQNAAYYFVVFTIASALYTVAYATMQSAFAEGSHNEAALKDHIKKAIKLAGMLLVPAAIAIFTLSGPILNVFGHEYAAGGTVLLQLFAMSAIGITASSALGAIFKITHHLRGVVVVNVVYAAGILGLSYVLIPKLGLVAIGWAWVIGTLASAGVGLVFIKINYTKGENHGKTSATRR